MWPHFFCVYDTKRKKVFYSRTLYSIEDGWHHENSLCQALGHNLRSLLCTMDLKEPMDFHVEPWVRQYLHMLRPR